jgi:hypothetical protein
MRSFSEAKRFKEAFRVAQRGPSIQQRLALAWSPVVLLALFQLKRNWSKQWSSIAPQ